MGAVLTVSQFRIVRDLIELPAIHPRGLDTHLSKRQRVFPGHDGAIWRRLENLQECLPAAVTAVFQQIDVCPIRLTRGVEQ